MYLGVEIGGTKLQFGVAPAAGGDLVACERLTVEPARGAAGILEQIERAASLLIARHAVIRIGIGFGGPVDAAAGAVRKSHQIDGWDGVPLAGWCEKTFGVPAVLGNDCDVAALAEARHGAGRGKRIVFYVTVGTGVGGGLVLDGQIHGSGRPAVAEIGQLRPGLHADRPEETVESLASGWGIAAAAQARLSGHVSRPLEALRRAARAVDRSAVRQHLADVRQADEEYSADLLQRAGGDVESITARHVAQAAAEGNEVALDVIHHACQALGWAIAQAVTLTAPEVVVVGGGVSLMGEHLFFAPLREAVDRYVFPPLCESFAVVPAELGELAVVHGALALAALKRG
jgi:glucokinase